MSRKTVSVFGSPIDVIDWAEALKRLVYWGERRESRVVCICNAHSVVTSRQDSEFQRVVVNADMATPDGAPVAWLMRRLGVACQERINGPDLMWKYCEMAMSAGDDYPSIYLYGGAPTTLELLQKRLLQDFPKLKIAGSYSPPFRQLTSDEDEEVVRKINESGAGVVWVSLGCPKQEKWMHAHKGKISAVMVGVGAAFDYHAETIQRAPLWMQKRGLEWLHRLASEPTRLWRRYLVTNTLFVFYAIRQLVVG